MRVHTYSSGESGILANAYLVETGDGIVAIDATLTVSDARALRARLDALGRPLLAALLTHGHPDHYNGLAILTDGFDIPVVATEGVDRVIREWDERKEAQWRPVFGDEWPSPRTFPNTALSDGGTLRFGGVAFTVHDLGPGESHHDSFWTASEGETTAVFSGDVLFHREHAYVSDGHTSAWLANLDRVRRVGGAASTIYPGHGQPGGPELYDAQRAYLELYRRTVDELRNDEGILGETEKERLTAVMTRFLPDAKLTFLIALGADAVAAELRRADAIKV